MSTTTTVTHPDGTVVTCTTTTVASPEKLVLKYGNGRGLMEVARQMLAVSEMFRSARLRSAMCLRRVHGPFQHVGLGVYHT